MPDNTVTITFNNDVIFDTQGNSYTVTGSAVVDFTTDSYNYTWKLTNTTGSVNGSEFGSSIPRDANGNYVLGHGTFNTTYNPNMPSQAVSMVFTGVTPNYSGFNTSITTTPGGTVVVPPVCFVTGTLIRTTLGDIPVEDLKVGDRAVTASGATRPIVWIGQKRVDCSAHAVPSQVWPVRVAAGAFGSRDGDLVPARDLYLSPGHPVQVGEDADAHLVPIMCLVNGTTIERVPFDHVTYWHVELDAHDLLLAEGLAAESYLDWGDRPWFANAGEHALMNPDFVVPGLAGRCLPVAVDGPVVEAERRRLDTVFAMKLVSACAWPTAFDALALN